MRVKTDQNRNKKIKKKFKTGEVVEAILRVLAVVSIVGTSIVFPNFPIVLGTIISLVNELGERKDIDNFKIKRALNSLQKRKIIDIEEIDDEILVVVNEKAKSLLLRYSIKELLNYKLKKKKWDKKWRLIAFDVAEEERKKRDFLRRTLKWIGFVQYQKSIFVFPYDCEKEINYLKNILAGKYDIKYIVAENIDDSAKLAKLFNLGN